MSGDASVESLTIVPPAREWARLIASRPRPAHARRFREQLGLPPDRPVVMTGHQAEFWHPGILAKHFAADAAARAFGCTAAWVFVDQADPPANTVVRYPARGPDGRLVARAWDAAAGARGRSGFGCVDAGLAAVERSWIARAGEPTPVRRMIAVLSDLLAPLIPPAPIVLATELGRTDLFAALVEAMRRNPASCVAAHNSAARAHPSAHVRALVADEVQDRFELPLWHVPPGGTRRRVYAESLASTPVHELAPRAVLLTGILRLAGCDLFIHGTGGGGDECMRVGERARTVPHSHEGYDRVTEDWLGAWARSDGAVAGPLGGGLAPIAVVTATRFLPIAGEPIPGAPEVARARWLAHRARHDPALLRDERAAAAKRALVAEIAGARRHSRERSDLYARMHEGLDRARRDHASDLDALARRAADADARRADAAIAHDRTRPFPLYPEATLRGLRDEIRAAFGVAP